MKNPTDPARTPSIPLVAHWGQLQGVLEKPERIIWAPDGKEMALVPAGPFVMGTTVDEARRLVAEFDWSLPWALAETPQRRPVLPAYYVDVTPVTQAEYARFLLAVPHHPVPAVEDARDEVYGWDEGARLPRAGQLADHPVVLVSWHDAMAYVAWARKELPDESRWEKAARGVDGRRFPWGDKWDAERLNSAQRLSQEDLVTVGRWQAWWKEHGPRVYRAANTTAVGQYPSGASPYGAQDMAGNVWEWCDDWYKAYPGNQAGHPNFGRQFRVLRGGSWVGNRRNTRCAFRLRNPAAYGYNNVGFRGVSPFL